MDNKNPKISLTIIIPVYNEEDGITGAINQIYKDLKSPQIKNTVKSSELIIVDDGSTDKTYQILQQIKKKHKKIKIIHHKFNQGLGASIISGVSHSTKKYITYLPADGQAFLQEIDIGLKLAPFADLVLTYRGVKNDYNPYRQILSNSLMLFMRFFFNLNFKDYNWVHIYKRDLFKVVKTKSQGVFYLGEVVVRSNMAGLKIAEAQAKYHPRSTGYSKNAKPSIVLRTFIDLLKLWMELDLKPRLR